MSLLKKHEKSFSDISVQFVECLGAMAVNGDESSFLNYTLEWGRIINRGGLFEINDNAYQLFKEIEIKIQKKLLSILESTLSLPSKRELVIDAVASDDDVQFHWVLLSCDITNEEDAISLLKEIIGLWLTIRGFSIAGTWLEQYKYKNKAAGTSKTKGLRKTLKRSHDATHAQEGEEQEDD